MGLKYHTVIFVPHARARFRKWRVTNRQLHFATGVALLLVAGSLFTTWSFFTNSIDRNELDQVTREINSYREAAEQNREDLRQTIGEMNRSVDRLKDQS